MRRAIFDDQAWSEVESMRKSMFGFAWRSEIFAAKDVNCLPGWIIVGDGLKCVPADFGAEAIHAENIDAD